MPAPPPTEPRAANDVSGELGQDLADGASPVAVVNTRAMRLHPHGPDLARVVFGAFESWDEVVPRDVVDPLRDTEWIFAAGALKRGETRNTVFLARTNFDEPRAHEAWEHLEKHLDAERTGHSAYPPMFVAESDGSRRAYVRRGPVVAVVPEATSTKAVDLLARSPGPAALPPGELLRLTASASSDLGSSRALPGVDSFRASIRAEGARLVFHLEGSCADAATATRAATFLRTGVEDGKTSNDPSARLFRNAQVITAGATLHYQNELDEGDLAGAKSLFPR